MNGGLGVHFDLEDDSSGSGSTQFVNETIRDLESGVGSITFGPTLCQALVPGATATTFATATHIHSASTCYMGIRGFDGTMTFKPGQFAYQLSNA